MYTCDDMIKYFYSPNNNFDDKTNEIYYIKV